MPQYRALEFLSPYKTILGIVGFSANSNPHFFHLISSQGAKYERNRGSDAGPLEGTMTKLVLGIAAGLAVALLAGWIWGASGRTDMARALQSSELQGELLGARAALLDARVAIYSVNFGEASRHLENARGLLRRADDRLKSLGRDDEVKQVQAALASIDEAQRMAGKLDQSANARAGEAAKIVADVLDAEAKH
jgi:hypothetical protein